MRCALAFGIVLVGLTAAAGPKTSKTPPSPLNPDVRFKPYADTDIAEVVFLTSRKEYRVGHPPYVPGRFLVAEYLLIAAHLQKVMRPDYKAEVKLAPSSSKPELMANKTFQGRFHDLQKAHRDVADRLRRLRVPPECKESFAALRQGLEDELFLAEQLAEHLFPAQDTRAREKLEDALKPRLRDRDPDAFDRLLGEFKSEGDLSKLIPGLIDRFVQPKLERAATLAEQAMAKVGLENATAVDEPGDIVAP